MINLINFTMWVCIENDGKGNCLTFAVTIDSTTAEIPVIGFV